VHYFPAHLCVVNEKTGEEKDFCLVFSKGELTVEEFAAKAAPAAEPEKPAEDPTASESETG
jgi:hypothetical protein